LALGATLGGLLNATFGNAAEFISALMTLARGPEMFPLVKASLTNSIIGSVLLVLGGAILAAALLHKRQKFNRTSTSLGATPWPRRLILCPSEDTPVLFLGST
jgi:Ca2+:H+ antiporter